MRQFIKRFISRTIENDFVWRILDKSILRAAQFTDIQRDRFEREQKKKVKEGMIYETIKQKFPDLSVKHGPFAGMKYPAMESVGSALFPKLLGSYEKELAPLLEKVLQRNYTEVVDIGCAEGYYAVGLAMKLPNVKVYAYDTDDEAVDLCKKMAEINGVSNRLIMGAFCDPETLQNIPFTEKALIVSDCEGYEKKLFNEQVVRSLKNHDILIEIHDCIDISISEYIRQVFEKTHNIAIIESIDDIKKAKQYEYQELEGYNLATRKDLLAEHRASIMEWFFIYPKHETF